METAGAGLSATIAVIDMARPSPDHLRVVPAAEGNKENMAAQDQERPEGVIQDPEI
jgi:hypothetical protein